MDCGLAVGSDADLVIFDPEKTVRLTIDITAKLTIRSTRTTPVMDIRQLPFPGGEIVQEEGHFKGKKGRGRFVKRKPCPNKRLELQARIVLESKALRGYIGSLMLWGLAR